MSDLDRHPLPIVEEIGVEFRAEARRRLAGLAEPVDKAPRPSFARATASRRAARRMTRRVAIAVALMGLIAGVAVAAHLSSGDGSGDTKPSPVARGRDWSLSAFRHDGHLCLELRGRGSIAESCSPGLGPVRAASLLEPDRRLVVGLATAPVRAVEVTVTGHRVRATTRPPLDPGAAAKAGVPSGARWYLATFPRDLDGAARIRALSAGGRPLGRPVLDCSLGARAAGCRREARAEADATLGR